MESALTPREIQTRIRLGETLADVAKAAGVPVEQIEPYAAPVVAERAHLATTALNNPVRRRGEGSSVRALRAVVTDRLQARGIDVDTVEWDAWRNPDRSWTIQGSYHSGSAVHEPHFTYDQVRRFSVAANDDARWLINESSSAHGPQPGRRRPDPDAEPTVDLNDEWALVRATAEDRPVVPAPDPVAPDLPGIEDRPEVLIDADEEIVRVDDDDEELTLPEYAPVELDEVDGVYDIVPSRESDLDVLYEMLSAFNEDSVNIYAGLSRPDSDTDSRAVPAVSDLPLEVVPEEPDAPDAPQTTDVPPIPVAAESRESPESPDSPVVPVEDAAGQTPLIESPAPAAKPRQPRKKGRAAIPSWDEIMFGGPVPKDPLT